MPYVHEKDMYPDIKTSVANFMNLHRYRFTIYDTYDGNHVEIERKFVKEINILSNTMKPDFIVIYNDGHDEKVLIIEVKLGTATIKDIGQAKMYGDIFSADYVWLVSAKKPRESLKIYYEHNNKLLQYYCAEKNVELIELKDGVLRFQNAFPAGRII